MLKPSLLSIGRAIVLLLLGGSGIAILSLWSHSEHVEKDRDDLQASLREARKARVAAVDAQHTAEQEREAMEKQIATGLKDLASADESKRLLTNQLAKMQAQDRELTAARGTLQLRDQEMVALRQQLEQTRSDYAALLVRRDTARPTGEASRPDELVAADDLVPVPTRDTTPPLVDGGSGKSQTTAKPAATEPIRFDDRGWKSLLPPGVR